MDTPDLVDARGRAFTEGGYRRVVSLVPSITETLFAMGAGPRLVGRTRWCTEPANEVGSIPEVGGTKTVDVEAVLALLPDLVIANREENTRKSVDSLDPSVPVFVTYPRTVGEVIDMCRDLGRLLALREATALTGSLEDDLARALASRPHPPVRTITLIWWNPAMVAGPDTYVSDLLATVGALNAIETAGNRYPAITPDEITALDPEVILLPDEPYQFTPDLARRLETELRGSDNRVIPCRVLSGELVTWFGWRTGRALRELGPLLSSPL